MSGLPASTIESQKETAVAVGPVGNRRTVRAASLWIGHRAIAWSSSTETEQRLSSPRARTDSVRPAEDPDGRVRRLDRPGAGRSSRGGEGATWASSRTHRA